MGMSKRVGRGPRGTTEPKTMQKAVQISGALTDEVVRNRSIKKVEKRGNKKEPSKDKNGRNDNKRTRTRNAFAIIANPVGRENTGAWPKCTTCNSYHAPGGPCRTCFNYNRPGHFARDCRVVPKNVNPVNVRNPTPARGACHKCGSTDHLKPACPRLNRAQGRGNYPNQVVANNGGQDHGTKGTKLGVGHSCWEQTKLTRIRTLSRVRFRYEIEIASGQLVEIDKVIKGCKLEIEGHVFDIDLIPFGHGSFDVIIGMDWLSNHKAGIIYHEKVVRIPLLDGNVLRVLRERTEEKARLLMSVKASDMKQEEIVVVRDFSEVFPDDLLGLPPLREIKFRIELIPGAVPIAKTHYCLAHSELVKLLGQLKELQDKELFSDYDCEIRYHPGKANVVTDALSRKKRLKPKRKWLDEMIEQRSDWTLYYLDQIWVPLKGDVRTLIMDEAHKSKYSVHPGADKMYYDLSDRYWWSSMKKDIAVYVRIAMDFVTKFPRTSSGHGTIFVIVDRLTKSAYFLPMREDYKMDRLTRLYLNGIVARYGVPISIISDRDSRFTLRFWQSMKLMESEMEFKSVSTTDVKSMGESHMPVEECLISQPRGRKSKKHMKETHSAENENTEPLEVRD
nr:hypothetical protein [Tanacetum cinerariifolium]